MPPVRSVAARMGRAAFLAPWMRTVPYRGFPPSMTNCSNVPPPFTNTPSAPSQSAQDRKASAADPPLMGVDRTTLFGAMRGTCSDAHSTVRISCVRRCFEFWWYTSELDVSVHCSPVFQEWGASASPTTCTSVFNLTPNRSSTVRTMWSINASTSVAVACPRLMMKLACWVDTSASPTR